MSMTIEMTISALPQRTVPWKELFVLGIDATITTLIGSHDIMAVGVVDCYVCEWCVWCVLLGGWLGWGVYGVFVLLIVYYYVRCFSDGLWKLTRVRVFKEALTQ